MNYQIN